MLPNARVSFHVVSAVPWLICRYIEEFVALVTEGDPAVTKRVIREWSSPGQVGFYEIVETLVVYYQMETRNDLRLALLRLFGCLGELDTAVRGMRLLAILPRLLAACLPAGHAAASSTSPGTWPELSPLVAKPRAVRLHH